MVKAHHMTHLINHISQSLCIWPLILLNTITEGGLVHFIRNTSLREFYWWILALFSFPNSLRDRIKLCLSQCKLLSPFWVHMRSVIFKLSVEKGLRRISIRYSRMPTTCACKLSPHPNEWNNLFKENKPRNNQPLKSLFLIDIVTEKLADVLWELCWNLRLIFQSLLPRDINKPYGRRELFPSSMLIN
jgi:hypothetical protein